MVNESPHLKWLGTTFGLTPRVSHSRMALGGQAQVVLESVLMVVLAALEVQAALAGLAAGQAAAQLVALMALVAPLLADEKLPEIQEVGVQVVQDCRVPGLDLRPHPSMFHHSWSRD